MYGAKIIVKESTELLKAYFDALKPEEGFKSERGSYKVNLSDDLEIDIEAQDATAFRAITTSLVGLMSLVEKTWRKVKND
jgi:tRNA threonylcarbamoyladenosine modification (KEOPS) complex  Pcc1 subunit